MTNQLTTLRALIVSEILGKLESSSLIATKEDVLDYLQNMLDSVKTKDPNVNNMENSSVRVMYPLIIDLVKHKNPETMLAEWPENDRNIILKQLSGLLAALESNSTSK